MNYIYKFISVFILTQNNQICKKEKKMETLEQLEKAYFILEMQDKWDSEDYKYANELKEKIKKLKGEN
jgi:enolase